LVDLLRADSYLVITPNIELPKKKVVVKKMQPLEKPIELPKKKTLLEKPPQSKLEEYNTFIKSQREEILKTHPSLTKAQTLEMARASYKASKASKITSCAPPTL
jgi:hypothetical protein